MELLVVISIIGILSSTVYIAANGARAKAKDSALVSATSEMEKQIATSWLLEDTHGSVMAHIECPSTLGGGTSIFHTNEKIQEMIAGIREMTGGSVYCATGNETGTDATSWAFAAPIPSSGGSSFLCIDSITGAQILSQAKTHHHFISITHAFLGPPSTTQGLGGGSGYPAACPSQASDLDI